jgi:protein transport protein SEC13
LSKPKKYNSTPYFVILQILDRTIKIYNVSDTSYQLSATLHGHEGPVWQVSWGHPKYGVILASCGFDGTILIHREVSNGNWQTIHTAKQIHESSINGICFAPHEYGLMLAAASSDGRVSILQHQSTTNMWSIEYLQDCSIGVNAVSWAPYGSYYNPITTPTNPDGTIAESSTSTESPRIVTAGCDNNIRIWVCTDGMWTIESTLSSTSNICHTDWVRDVAWAPCLLPNHNIIASCSEDRTVIIWTQEQSHSTSSHDDTTNASEWTGVLLHTFDLPVWRVSWSVTGHMLAVSSGESNVTLWKSSLDGIWTQVSAVEESITATASTTETGEF